jgi:peptidoglycan/LPS O-acetylase OafA/YrhL
VSPRASGEFHIPSLDGIRAIAAFIVFLSHCGLEDVIPGGFGVTIFFFLSGFLITTLLRQEYEKTDAISLKKFYLRRFYRIIPPLYIVLLVLLLPYSTRDSTHHATNLALVAQFAQLTNYYQIFWGGDTMIPGTGQMWSLAVEEHFYLLFPLVLSLLLQRRDYRHIGFIFAGACVAVLAWRCLLLFGFGVGHDYIYFATDTRIDSLLYGCIMGVWLNPVLGRQFVGVSNARWMAVLALATAVLGVTFLYRSENFRETFRYSLQGVALFPIFFCAVRKNEWPLFRWLETRPIRFLGLISYTFYLIHLKALVIVHRYTDAPMAVRAVLGFMLAVAFSSAMYFLVERHLGALRRRLHPH